MNITRGLVIDDPWIGYILSGTKIWEMRSRNAQIRGPIGLIRKGTKAVWGVATLSDVGSPLSHDEMIRSMEKHCIPLERIAELAKHNRPWMLENVQVLPHPIPYQHRRGAQSWVKFSTQETRQIDNQLHAERLLRGPS